MSDIDLTHSEGTFIIRPSLQITEAIRACVESNDPAAWQDFVACSTRQITLSIIRTMRRWGDFRQDPIDDLVQDTYIKLCADQCRLLYQFSLVHPDAVEGYIRTAAINVAHDFVKSQRSQKRGNGKVGQFPEHVEPAAVAGSMGSQSAIEHTILMRQIEQCLEQCTEESSRSRDCLIFWLHYQQGMTASHIASLSAVGLTVKGVESVIHRLTRQVRERLAQFETQKNVKPRLEGFGRA